jgi:hypothetical protein
MFDFIAELKESPIGRQLLADREQRARSARQQLVDALAEAAALEQSETEALAQALRPLKAAEEKARVELDKRTAARVAHEHAAGRKVGAARARVSQLTRELRASADPRIAQAEAAMWSRFESERHTMARSKSIDLPGADSWNRPRRGQLCNSHAIERLLAAMRATTPKFEALKVQNPDNLEAAIAAILEPVETAWSAIETFDDEAAA